MKRAILVVDIQKEYFPGGNYPLVGIEAAAANAARVIADARSRGDLVVHVRHEFPQGPIFIPGTPGVESHETVAPAAGEPVVTKNRVNSFRDTGLEAILRDHGVELVAVIGAMSHMCVDAAVRAANDLGFSTTTIHDACATRDLEFGGVTTPAAQVQAAMMAAFAFGYGQVVSTDDWLG
ncbi:MAG: cysteine hydrolase family protein [Paracoccus sp. (in: a-proteobacteria)]|uniref:cysteine hydrolase family protein n=1 Tax=Paracoccus sp. TaxID=267 RepID=UPI0026DFD601|nr:cysteine hydrolase family protein [Paracoccus sp. (in: a-proteobacteria)]MDO5620395.1 cysteine hydrolase family protein [Paracoccus sp. (in: a-proteobacteria)]